jgi:hypothetical protein
MPMAGVGRRKRAIATIFVCVCVCVCVCVIATIFDNIHNIHTWQRYSRTHFTERSDAGIAGVGVGIELQLLWNHIQGLNVVGVVLQED